MSEYTQEELDELNFLAGIPDSANMPTSMAVNQKQLAEEASHELAATPRSKYYGVYNNTNESNIDKFAFRSAVRLGNGATARWMNLGYFNCEHVAAMAYNVAAMNYFGVKSWLNPVDTTLCDHAEYARFKNERADYIVKSVAKVNAITAAGGELQYIDLTAERVAASA